MASPDERLDTIVATDRRDLCFYWQRRPGTMTPAAVELQKRESGGKEDARDRRLTVLGLWSDWQRPLSMRWSAPPSYSPCERRSPVAPPA